MKITKERLKQIIKEELEGMLSEESGGYHVKMVRKEYGGQVPKFYGPEGNELEDEYGDSLASGDILEATEKLDGFFDIVNKETLEAHRAQSRFPYPDSEVMMDRGFMPGKGYEDLLQLYAAKVLRTSGLNEAGLSQSLMGFPKEDIDAIIMMLNAEYGGLSMTPGERMNKAVALLKHFKGDVEAAVVDPQVVLGDPKVA